MKVKCQVLQTTLQGDYGDVDSVCATCSRCGHTTESYGTGEGSIKRCLVLLSEECPEEENNFYYDEDDEPYDPYYVGVE